MTGQLQPDVPRHYLLSPVGPAPRRLIDTLYETAGHHPETPAIDDGEVQLTYAELIADIEDSVRWSAPRGALTLHVLRWRLGDANLFALPKDCTARYRHSTVVTDAFTGPASHYSMESLLPLWDCWPYSTALPELDRP